MGDSVYSRMGSAYGVATQSVLQQKANEERKSFFDKLPPPSAALKQYKIDKYGQEAQHEWSKREAKYRETAKKVADSQRDYGEKYFGLTNRQAQERQLQLYKDTFINTFIDEKFKNDKSPQQHVDKSRRQGSGRRTTQSAPKVELPKAETQQQPQIEIDPDLNARTTTIGRSTSQVFDINSFRSEILENDVLPSHSYLVTFAQFRTGVGKEVGPLNDFVINKRNTLMMRCENVVLPAPSLLEEENIRRYGYGAVEKVPYGVQFSDVTITWLVDKNSEIIDFMHQWMNTIVMHDSPNTLMKYGSPTRPNLDAYAPFEVGYKDAYANPIVRIYVYNRQQQTVTEYELYDVFPMNIQSMNLSWSDENQVQKLTVTFAYTNMKVNAPIKSKEQYNYYQEGRTSPYEEREQPDDKGGKAAADRKETNLLDYVTKQMNASKPIATDGQYDYYNVEVPETAGKPTPPTPIVHNLTTG